MLTRPDPTKRLVDALSQPGGASTDFDLNPQVKVPADRVLKPAAVLVCVRPDTGALILTKRSAHLKHHPGQIAFPGGKQDAGDVTLADAALREADEEIGLPRDQVDVLGALPHHVTVTGYKVTPIIAVLRGDYTPVPEPGEVSEIFEVPLDFVTNPANIMVQSRHWQGQQRHFYVVPYGPYYIWGATARILRGLADRIHP